MGRKESNSRKEPEYFAKLDSETAHARRSYIRGLDSEEKVRDILLSQNLVESTELTLRYSYDDRAGTDIRLWIKKELLAVEFPFVRVQVKSSPGGILDFRERLKRRFKPRLSDEGVQAYLLRERLIIIDASQPVVRVERSFNDQLNDILEYWRFE